MSGLYCKSLPYLTMRDFKAKSAKPSTATSRPSPRDSLPKIIHEKRGQVAVITLNKPKALNSCDEDMTEGLYRAFKAIEGDHGTSLVVIKGSGRAFCAGGSLQSFVNGSHNPKIFDYFNMGIDFSYRSLYKLSELPVPTIALMDGLTIGLGVGLSYNSGFRIATENTLFLMPETSIGHFCDATTCYYLSRLDGNYGRYLALCSRKLKADDVMIAGIATHFVPACKLSSLIHKLANLQSPNAETIDKEINKLTVNFMETSSINIEEYGEKRRIINECFRFDTVEEIIEALEKEGSEFSLASKAEILRGSPQALKVTLELLRRAQSLTLKECVILERQLWKVNVVSHDFMEGCMSKMQKRKPAWNPTKLSDFDLERDVHSTFFAKTNAYVDFEFDI